MLEQWYKVTLESDVAVTANAATTGGHVGLDYLPGSLFLGAAVAQALKDGRKFDPNLFFSSRIRFFDAFPAVGCDFTFPIPLSFHWCKGEEWDGKPPLNLLTDDEGFIGQPKQWRHGYMSVDGQVIDVKKNARMKTAIERESGRSAKGELFGYEAIVKGTVFFQKIQAENSDDLAFIDGMFAERTLRLGRSRSAEYGIVRLEKHSPGNTGTASPCKNGVVSLYLLSDMALVRDGMPTLVPRAEDFGLKEASLIPGRCFMRSRSYSPWNAFYNCRMTERNVLCKGSVISFIVKDSADIESLQRDLSRGVGLYREEGMGQVLVNPEWLLQPPVLRKARAHEPKGIIPSDEWKSPLILFLREKTEQQDLSRRAFEDGLKWAKEWFQLSEKIARTGQMVPGKSQWSAIRSLADRFAGDRKSLLNSLEEFCTKGIRRKKWQSVVRESGKETCLYDRIREQIERACDDSQKTPDEYVILTLHHAAVEMGRMLARAAEKKGRVRSR